MHQNHNNNSQTNSSEIIDHGTSGSTLAVVAFSLIPLGQWNSKHVYCLKLSFKFSPLLPHTNYFPRQEEGELSQCSKGPWPVMGSRPKKTQKCKPSLNNRVQSKHPPQLRNKVSNFSSDNWDGNQSYHYRTCPGFSNMSMGQ